MTDATKKLAEAISNYQGANGMAEALEQWHAAQHAEEKPAPPPQPAVGPEECWVRVRKDGVLGSAWKVPLLYDDDYNSIHYLRSDRAVSVERLEELLKETMSRAVQLVDDSHVESNLLRKLIAEAKGVQK